MKITIKICLIIFMAAGFGSSLFSAEKKRIAVMPFEFGGGITQEEAGYITEKVRTELISTGLFEVISNDQIENMMAMEAKKQGVGPGSCSTEQCIIDLGNALECEKMLIGKAAGAFGEFSVTGKILDVVSQQYEKAQAITIPDKDDFPEAAKEMVEKLTELYREGVEAEAEAALAGIVTFRGMIWRNIAVPGWGHVYASQDRGWAYLALWAGSGGAFLSSQLSFTNKKNEYDSLGATNTKEEFDAAFNEYKSANSFRTIMSFVFLAAYLIPISDIIFTGKAYTVDPSSKMIDIQFNLGTHLINNNLKHRKAFFEEKFDFQFIRRFK
ncbi:MAG: hypothetical protein OEZ13_09085 [Spirochaetia bacterium]|nr:hypothetical protein [Spirochaetia bacterium]